MERYDFITRNLQEVIEEKELRELIDSGKEISLYWGTMPTGSISIAYFFPMMKISDFLRAGIRVKVLLADLHAALDGVAWDILEKRYEYYKEAIILMLKTIDVDISKLEFVKGSDLQKNPDYFVDVLKLSTIANANKCIKAASEVVKQIENPKLSGMIYPVMQAVDEEYLQVDCQFGGMDQRKIMVFAREYLPKIGYKQRVELINPLIRGLVGEKMSSSVENSKIDLMDSEEDVKKKINKADCVEGDPDNGIMALLKYLIFVMKNDRGEKFVISRPEKFGGDLEYETYDRVEKDFTEKKLHPLDLKNGVAAELNKLLAGFRSDENLRRIHSEAY